MAEDKSNKTEKPTQWRLKNARKEGNIPRSKEINEGIILLAIPLFMIYFLPFIADKIKDSFVYYYGLAGSMRLNMTNFVYIMQNALTTYMYIIIPISILFIMISFIATTVQGGFIISFKKMKLNMGRLNPIKGIKKVLLSRGTIVELIKNLIKVIVITWIAYSVINGNLEKLIYISRNPLSVILKIIGSIAFSISFKVALFIIFISIFDYIYQRYDFMENLKMSKQEVREEFKQYEGDPQIKGRIRNIQYGYAMKRMMQEVPKADVVITNPTHYAVALKYDKRDMRAPELVAKGADYIALKIKSVAKENSVPIVENPPLARKIYKDVEINETIPLELYQAVAEVLAYVYKLKNRRI